MWLNCDARSRHIQIYFCGFFPIFYQFGMRNAIIVNFAVRLWTVETAVCFPFDIFHPQLQWCIQCQAPTWLAPQMQMGLGLGYNLPDTQRDWGDKPWGPESCTTDPLVVDTLSQGYNLQFWCRPPVLSEIRLTTVSNPHKVSSTDTGNIHPLGEEVYKRSRSSYTARWVLLSLFSDSKKEGGFHPI